MSWSVFLVYVGTWFLVALTPGPAVFNAMSQASRFGFRASLAGIAGTQLGNLIFFIGIAFGFASLLNAASGWFDGLRIVGAIYLCYLGLKIIVGTLRRSANPPSPVHPVRRNLLLQGVVIQLTNPKALLFVSALLPHFINPEGSVVVQLSVLFLATALVDFAVLGGYAFASASGARSLRESSLATWLQRIFGAALVLFGCRLLFSRK